MKKYEDDLTVAFRNGLLLASILMEDLEDLLDSESESESWYRNFIRAAAALIDGYVYCSKEIALVALDFYTCPEANLIEDQIFSNRQLKAILTPDALGSKERIKHTLNIAYDILNLSPKPNFSSVEWERVLELIDKRNQLMHPINVDSLKISRELFEQYRQSIKWLFNEIGVFKKLHDQLGFPNEPHFVPGVPRRI
jgi:hypothetical protein